MYGYFRNGVMRVRGNGFDMPFNRYVDIHELRLW